MHDSLQQFVACFVAAVITLKLITFSNNPNDYFATLFTVALKFKIQYYATQKPPAVLPRAVPSPAVPSPVVPPSTYHINFAILLRFALQFKIQYNITQKPSAAPPTAVS